MTDNEWTEHDIQALKAQEAKDLAIEFLQQLHEKERGPISIGEIQLQELEYELKIKQAERADQKAQREHEARMKELELEMERERSRAAESQRNADEVRQRLSELVDRVRQSEESLGIGLERSMREHRLRLEQLETDYAARKAELDQQHEDLLRRRDGIVDEIKSLTELQVSAEDLQQLRNAVQESSRELEQQKRSLEEELGTLEFEKTKQLTATQRSLELDLAKIKADHDKEVLRLDREAAEKILEGLQLRAVSHEQWDQLQRDLANATQQRGATTEEDEARIRDGIRRQFNITTDEPIDVTDLFYQHRSAAQQLDNLRSQLQKVESELARARQHIEGEPQRIATAIDAARTQVQNIVEPASKR